MSDTRDPVEDLLRELAPQVLATLARQYGQFEAAEDATQEALFAALTRWPENGTPDNPRGWLLTVARRSLIDQWRSESARRRREQSSLPDLPVLAGADEQPLHADDTLILLFMCCHPALSPQAQIALTLRAVGGLTTTEIARALLVPEDTMAKRITRAKRRITEAGGRFELPPAADLHPRLHAVLTVLYLIFNEGYTASSGEWLHRVDLSTEAIRLARLLHSALPADGEVAGLVALMLLTDARRPARTEPDGSLVPLDKQDRSRWDGEMIREGLQLVTDTLGRFPIGQYQLQAAIAASTTRPRRPTPPTGRRSSPSTTPSSRSPPVPWSRSAAPSPWRWCTGRSPAWRSSGPCRMTPGRPARTACTPSGLTCSRWPASYARLGVTTSARRG